MKGESTTLSAKKREQLGSRYARRVRNAGGLPAVVYGHKEEPVSVTLDAHEAGLHILRGEKVFNLKFDEGGTEQVLLKDIQYDHLGTNVVHVDFARVDLNERVTTHAHIVYVGDAPGLKKAGAIMMHPHTELELECVVTNIPDEIEVDVSHLEAGEVIKAGDITLPKDTMVLLTDPNTIVAQIQIQAQADDTTGEAGEVEGGASPEVIKEKKEED